MLRTFVNWLSQTQGLQLVWELARITPIITKIQTNVFSKMNKILFPTKCFKIKKLYSITQVHLVRHLPPLKVYQLHGTQNILNLIIRSAMVFHQSVNLVTLR